MKTHFKKAFNSPYLSSADITEPTVLTIKCVKFEPNKAGRKDEAHNTAYFTEKEIRPGETLKPMVLNVTNCKVLTKMTGSPFIDDWQNVRVSIYVDTSVKFGRDMVEGLRISPKAPPAPIPPATDEQMIEIKKLKLSPAQLQWVKDNQPLNTQQAAGLIKRLSA